MPDYFQNEININAYYIGFDISIHDWLVVFSDNLLLYVVNSKVINQCIIMIPVNKLGSNNF